MLPRRIQVSLSTLLLPFSRKSSSESAPSFQLSQHLPSPSVCQSRPWQVYYLSRTTIKVWFACRCHPPRRHFSICEPETYVHARRQFAGYVFRSPCELLALPVCALENVPLQLATRRPVPLRTAVNARLSGCANFCVEP